MYGTSTFPPVCIQHVMIHRRSFPPNASSIGEKKAMRNSSFSSSTIHEECPHDNIDIVDWIPFLLPWDMAYCMAQD